MRLKSGEKVVDRFNSHLHADVEQYLSEALAQIGSAGRQFIIEEVVFGYVIGNTTCVETSSSDEIVFAQRPKRFGLTRFVKNRGAEPCKSLVVILKAGQNNEYVLITAFVGNRPEPEPWDERNFAQRANPAEAREKAYLFWGTHALVFGSEPIVFGTETKKCPW